MESIFANCVNPATCYRRLASFFGAFVVLFIVQLTVSNAASSQWHDLGGGQVRLLADLDPSTNKISGVVEIKLKKGWSTYWRYPGSSGIPPRFDFSKSLAYEAGETKFPAPSLITQEYGSYAGYKNKVMFPFEGKLLATTGAEINLDLLIGICSEVCIPATAQLTIKNNQLMQSDPEAVMAVSFAKITVPKVRDAEDIIISREQIDENDIYIKTKHKKSFGKPSMFVEGPHDWYLTPAELVSQEENTATFKLDVSRAPKGTHVFKHELRYTIVTGTSGIEILR